MEKNVHESEIAKTAFHFKILYGSLILNFSVTVFMIITLYSSQDCHHAPRKWTNRERFQSLHATKTTNSENTGETLKWMRFRRSFSVSICSSYRVNGITLIQFVKVNWAWKESYYYSFRILPYLSPLSFQLLNARNILKCFIVSNHIYCMHVLSDLRILLVNWWIKVKVVPNKSFGLI